MGNEGATLYLSAFVDELVRSGLKHIVISPGSRSTPIAVLAAEHAELKVWIHIDERSAAFFALGLAKRSGQPVALLCTSGTAAANYYPAIAEANLSRVPLVVLTADRPHELRDVGAPQTIDQLGMYGSHVKWFVEMPLPEGNVSMIRHARMVAARAVMTAGAAPTGVVHLNFPLREPLLPELGHPQLFSAERRADNVAYTADIHAPVGIAKDQLLDLSTELLQAGRGLIVVGPCDDKELASRIASLAELLNYPILADPLSQLRSGVHPKAHIIDSYDSFLRIEGIVKELQPKLFLRFGAMPVSKPLLLYMNKYIEAKHIVVDEGGWRDPTLLMATRITANAAVLSQQLVEVLREQEARKLISNLDQAEAAHSEQRAWLSRWQQIQHTSAGVLEEVAAHHHDGELFEGTVVKHLQQLMDNGSALFIGNSMPIRDVDSFWRNDEKEIALLANRGANGIDGLVSTAMGVSALQRGTVLLLGDLSFYHDLNGLLAAKLHRLDITIVVVNNDGGGIFSFLPQSTLPNHFEALFGTPIGLDYEHAAHLYGGQFQRVSSWEQFQEAFRQAQASGGLNIIEIPTKRELNVTLHRSIWPKLTKALVSQ